VATTTDFQSGAISVVDPEDGRVCDAVASSGPDAVVRAWDGDVVVFDRTGGTAIRRFAPGDYRAPTWSAGADPGENLHDVAPFDGALWFTAYERDALDVRDAGGAEVAAVSVADFDDADGLPEADRLAVTDQGLFVALQRLDRQTGWSSEDGVVAEVDRDGVVASWEVGPNPKLYADPSDPARLVALTGVFHQLDGGLVTLDPRDGAVETWLDEADLGYDLDGFAGIGDHAVVLGVEDDGTSRIGCLDLATGGWVDGEPEAGWLVDAVAGEDRVYVALRTGWAGEERAAIWSVDPLTCDHEVLADGFLLDPFTLAYAR
jgi:hypothetical protein